MNQLCRFKDLHSSPQGEHLNILELTSVLNCLQLRITFLIGQKNWAEESPAGAASAWLLPAVRHCFPSDGGSLQRSTELNSEMTQMSSTCCTGPNGRRRAIGWSVTCAFVHGCRTFGVTSNKITAWTFYYNTAIISHCNYIIPPHISYLIVFQATLIFFLSSVHGDM